MLTIIDGFSRQCLAISRAQLRRRSKGSTAGSARGILSAKPIPRYPPPRA